MMAQSPQDELQALRNELEQRLGLCLLRLQACELTIKDIAVYHEITATGHGTDLEARKAKTRRKTLGTLVKQLRKWFLTTDAQARRAMVESGSNDSSSGSRGRIRMQIAFPADDLTRMKRDLDAFVDLRNGLVHNFLEGKDLSSAVGLRNAIEALDEAADRIDHHRGAFREWFEDMQQMRQAIEDGLRSDMVQEWVKTGRLPGQSPRSGH